MSKINIKLLLIESLKHIQLSFVDWVSSFWGGLIGIYLFMFGEPTHALMAVGMLMVLDIITKLRSIAKNNNGYIRATIEGEISSRKIFEGTASKITAYFILLSIAYMTQYVISIDMAFVAFQSMIIAVIYIREAQSIIRNLISFESVGSERYNLLKFLKIEFNKKAEKVFEDINIDKEKIDGEDKLNKSEKSDENER